MKIFNAFITFICLVILAAKFGFYPWLLGFIASIEWDELSKYFEGENK